MRKHLWQQSLFGAVTTPCTRTECALAGWHEGLSKHIRDTTFVRVSIRFRVTQCVNLRHLQQRGNPAILTHVTQTLLWASDLASAWDAALPHTC